jgi:hypothetical protein
MMKLELRSFTIGAVVGMFFLILLGAGASTLEEKLSLIGVRLNSGDARLQALEVRLIGLENKIDQARTVNESESDSSAEKIQIKVLGQVRIPSSLSLDKGTPLMDAVSLSGGLTQYAEVGKIHIQRKGQFYKSLPYSIAAKMTLQDGDTIQIEEAKF